MIVIAYMACGLTVLAVVVLVIVAVILLICEPSEFD